METLQLRHLDEFRQILKDYQPSPEEQGLFSTLPFVVLLGPSGGGRNSTIDRLMETGDYEFVVSDTTRQPRANNGVMEVHGVHYHFRTEEEFLEGLRQGRYLEAEVIHGQQVSGVSIDEVRRAHEHGKTALADLGFKGCEAVARYSDVAKLIFITPPGLQVWLDRLLARGQLEQDELDRRLRGSAADIAWALDLGVDRMTFVINENLDTAVAEVERVAGSNGVVKRATEKARQTARELLADLNSYLEQ